MGSKGIARCSTAGSPPLAPGPPPFSITRVWGHRVTSRAASGTTPSVLAGSSMAFCITALSTVNCKSLLLAVSQTRGFSLAPWVKNWPAIPQETQEMWV